MVKNTLPRGHLPSSQVHTIKEALLSLPPNQFSEVPETFPALVSTLKPIFEEGTETVFLPGDGSFWPSWCYWNDKARTLTVHTPVTEGNGPASIETFRLNKDGWSIIESRKAPTNSNGR